MKNYKFGEIILTAVETGECDENFTEYDVFDTNGETVGQVTKYADEPTYTVWNEAGEELKEKKTLRGAVEVIAKELSK